MRRSCLVAVVVAVAMSCGGEPATVGLAGSGGSGGSGGGGGGGAVVTTGLVAYSNGTRIGAVVDVDEEVLQIWDTARDVLFYLNDVTGFVGGEGPPTGTRYYERNDCTDAPIFEVAEEWCDLGGMPRRQIRRQDGHSRNALTRAAELYLLSQPARVRVAARGPECSNYTETLCGSSYWPTTLIRTAYVLPIEILEE